MSEEIIIDGVDVAGCKNLYVPQESKICQCLDCETGEFVQCKREVYCYYKQLKRLQKENEELKNENSHKSNLIWYIYHCSKVETIQRILYEYYECINDDRCNEKRVKKFWDDVFHLQQRKKYKSKYKQALEEIKKWATSHNPCDIEANINCTKEDCFKCLNYDITKITKIIDEVLNDN